MNTFLENAFDFSEGNDCHLYYCGKREGSIAHKYGPYCRSVYLLNYVKEGRAEFQICGETVEVRAGDFYVMHPRCAMSYQTDPKVPWSIQWVVVDGRQIESLVQALGLTPEEPVFHVRHRERIQTLFDCLFLHTNRRDTAGKFKCLSLLYELFAFLAEERTALPQNPHVRQAIEIMNTHFSQKLTVQELAEQLHLNNNYFSKLFKRETGLTPMEALQQIRLEQAERLLKYTDLSVGEVAETVGFSDSLYFSRVFRQQTGKAPTAYRKATDGRGKQSQEEQP